MKGPRRSGPRWVMPEMRGARDGLVEELRDRITAAGLIPAEQVQVLAELLTAIGWRLAGPGLAEDRATLEARVTAQGDFASALILQGQILQEWLAEGGSPPTGIAPPPSRSPGPSARRSSSR